MTARSLTRCYRYALAPSPVQRDAMMSAAKTVRRHWNALVASQRYAEDEIEHGRRGSIGSELTSLLLGKKLTGVAVVKAQAKAQAEGISIKEAAELNRIAQAADSVSIPSQAVS